MAPMLADPPLSDFFPSTSTSICSDPSVTPSDKAAESTKALWWLHGHPHSKRYSDPKLNSLAALVRHDGLVYGNQPAFLHPATSAPDTPYETTTWAQFDSITETIAALYADGLKEELQTANESRNQPTVALLGEGKTVEYFCTQLALQKLGVRVLLLAESNAVEALHHLLECCNASVVIIDAKNANADTKGIRKMPIIEALPLNPITSAAEVNALKFQDFGDVWERHSFIIHSSGSTGMPKPIIHTNRSMMLIARMYGIFQGFEIKNWFLLFPLYHIAGISIALSGLPNGRVLSFPPLAWPPSSSGIFAAFKTLTKMGHPVDIIHCAPTLIENMYEYMTETKDFTPLTSLKILQPGGAALSSIIVNGLVNRGVNVKTTYGSTEIGPPMRTIPHTRDNPRCYAFRNLYPDNEKLKMEEVADGVYECVVYKGFELAAELWEGKPDDEPYRTNDLFIQDPPGSGFFVLQGRKDDILIHSNGENTSANPLQLDIQTASKTIKRALALGHSKPCVSLLVEVNDDFDPESESTKDEIWKTVKGVNERYPGHSRIIRSMIHILPRGKSLPVTPKGNVKRKEAQTLYQQDIDRLYSNDDGYSSPASDSNSLPLKEFIRSIFAELADVPSAEVKDFTTLYDLGIDSRLALSLRAALSKRIGPISLGTIFENPTIDKLLAFFQKKCQAVVQESRTQVIEKMISKLSAELTSWPTRLSSKSYSTPATETILLTGASGSLGTALLHFLSASSAVSKIYAMVRGPNNEAKLRNSITSRGLDVEAIMGTGKIEVINYSMQDSLLGLDIETYAMLARDVTIVVQNAWKMDFNQGVEYFEDDCIRNTMSLLRLTHAGRPKTLAFTSSVSTCLGTAAPASIPESPITSISSSPLVALNTGYAHSKYIIERLTQIASTQLNIPIRLLRVGQMCGNTKSGAWNVDEMWPIMFASSAKLGAVPMLVKVYGKRFDWIPVDVAGEAISEILLEPATPNPTVKYTVHNIVNPNPISWTSLVALLQKSGISSKPMEEISLSSWVGKLNDAVESGKDATEIPGLRLLQFFENMVEADGKEMGAEEEDRVFETMESRGVSAALRACPGFCGDWVEGNVKWWRYGGFC